MRRSGRTCTLAALVGLLAFAVTPAQAAAPGATTDALAASTTLSTDGVYQISWAGEDAAELIESRGPGFDQTRIVYRGTDNATVLTGRSDGVYRYHLRGIEGFVEVEVRHHPLSRALVFFTLGAIVFLATVALVVREATEEENDG